MKKIFNIQLVVTFLVICGNAYAQYDHPFAPSSGETIQFDWIHKGVAYSKLIDEPDYNNCLELYRELEPLSKDSGSSNYYGDAMINYVPGATRCKFNIHDVVEDLFQDIKENNFNKWDATNYVLNFVASIPYSKDEDTSEYSEYPRYPYQTILEKTGDCEDHAILFAAIMTLLGQDVLLIGMPEHLTAAVNMENYRSKPSGNHFGIEYNEKNYVICESTTSVKDNYCGNIPVDLKEFKKTPTFFPGKYDLIPDNYDIEEIGRANREWIKILREKYSKN